MAMPIRELLFWIARAGELAQTMTPDVED